MLRSARKPTPARRSRRRRISNSDGLSYSSLEDRKLLAAITVSTSADTVNGDTRSIEALIRSPGSDQAISLREAIEAANNTLAADTITFDANVFNGESADVIRLQSELRVLRSLEIDGGDLGVVVSGDSFGNDVTATGSFTTDVAASDAAGLLSDNTESVFAFLGGAFLGDNEEATISGLTITGGSSSERGGGIRVESFDFDFALNRSVVAGNRADESGGGIDFRGSQLTVDQSTVSGNVVQSARQDDFALGGGIATFGDGDIVISNSTISGNTARGFTQLGLGGGIQANSGSLSLISSTVSGNESSDTGGGVHSNSDSTVITDSTITENTANFGGGINVISFRDITFDLNNSIVAGNIAVSDNPDIVTGFEVLFAARSSLIGNDSGIAQLQSTGGSQIGTANAPIDPRLGALADNGGLTKTHSLSAGSPAFNAGSSSLAFDQRGLQRINGTTADIGAFELQGTFIVVDSSEGFSDGNLTAGDLSLNEAIEISKNTFETITIVFDPSVFDGEANDVIHLQEELFIDRSITIDAGELNVVISGDRDSNDALLPGTFITDIQDNFNTFDNVQPFSINASSEAIVTLRGLTITGGVNGFSNDNGGGIESLFATLVIENSVVAGNFADNGNGGGISVQNGSLIINNSEISDNQTDDFGFSDPAGGGIYAFDSEVTITGSTVSRNSAVQGGGIFSTGSLVTVVETEISDNLAIQNGGGITAFEGEIIVDRSTVSGNNAERNEGGGIFADTALVTVSNSTISGNSSESDGSAIKGFDGALTISDSTIVENRLFFGRGMIALESFNNFNPILFTVSNSIIAELGEFQADVTLDLRSSLIGDSQGSNLTPAPVGSPDANGNIIGLGVSSIDPVLGELADNGGPTQTHALLPGSPAIDSGNTTSTTDQRGLPRPNTSASGPDIGAFEEQSLTLIVDTSNDVSDGDFSTGNLSLREAIEQANANAGVDRISFDPQVFDGGVEDVIRLVNGELAITESLLIEAGDFQVVVSGDSLGNDVTDTDSLIVDIAASILAETVDDNSRVFNITTSTDELVSLTGLTITGGNSAAGGGGIFVNSAAVELTDVVIAGNAAIAGNQSIGGGGGGILTDSQLTLDGSSVSDNVALGVEFNDQFSEGNGGGIAAIGSDPVTLTNSTISENLATFSGGGIYTTDSSLTLNNSTVKDNSSNSAGGAIATLSGEVSIEDSTVSGNQSVFSGGGIITDTGSISLSQTTISGNSTTASNGNGGGGIATRQGRISIFNSIVNDNQSASDGGGVFVDNGSLIARESTISGNSSNGKRRRHRD